MSQINVNRIKDSNEGAPDFPSGVNVGGITSTVTLGVTNLNPTNLNVSGVVTATTLDGNLLATGTPTLGLGVTINASGLNISGVATAGIVSATTLYGDGTNITGVALSIAPLNYNPAVSGVNLNTTIGIGITFNQGVKAGSGNVTLRLVGAAGTVVENFGVGNSVTYSDSDYGTTVTIDPTADLEEDTVYHISYPSGAFTNLGGDVSYVGTAYTFDTHKIVYQMFRWGYGASGAFGNNLDPSTGRRSSPTQIPGTTWRGVSGGAQYANVLSVKSDNTLWGWGSNAYGALGQNSSANPSYHGYSSPVQIPGSWSKASAGQGTAGYGIKTDGTLWAWGYGHQGQLGINVGGPGTKRSSPVQVGSDTTWRSVESGLNHVVATKTDGTLWTWGSNDEGLLGVPSIGTANRSSPIQVPGTDWSTQVAAQEGTFALKTDGTFWAWGKNGYGQLGQNDKAHRSSPTQIPGTWSSISGSSNANMMTYSAYMGMLAIKTDGTAWGMGYNTHAILGQNDKVDYSSPIQIGTDTTWSSITSGAYSAGALKTDGTLWNWGTGSNGQMGVNNEVSYSSPIQVPGTDWNSVYVFDRIHWGVKKIFM